MSLRDSLTCVFPAPSQSRLLLGPSACSRKIRFGLLEACTGPQSGPICLS